MVGILCSNSRKNALVKSLHSLFKRYEGRSDEKIIVFTISNIDFSCRMVKGCLATGKKTEYIEVPLPQVILNLSVQHHKDGVRKQRMLIESEGTTLINNVNRFDQSMIMEMLCSSRKAIRYLLPFHVYNKEKRDFKPDDNKSYIAMPAKGSSLSRMIFTRPASRDGKIYGSQYFRKGRICDYIDASLCQKRWIFLELPELLAQNNFPCVVRVYLQRNCEGEWRIIGKSVFRGIKISMDALSKRLDEASLSIICCVSRFIPSLGHCFIDFVISTDLNLFFLHLSGLNYDFFSEKHNDGFYKKFYCNLLELGLSRI